MSEYRARSINRKGNDNDILRGEIPIFVEDGHTWVGHYGAPWFVLSGEQWTDDQLHIMMDVFELGRREGRQESAAVFTKRPCDRLVMPSRRTVVAHGQVIGILPTDGPMGAGYLVHGYVGRVEEETLDQHALDAEDRRYLADVMIKRWQTWAAMEPPANSGLPEWVTRPPYERPETSKKSGS